MKSQRTASAVSISTGRESGAVERVASPTRTSFNKSKLTQPASSARMHTLILIGELDYRSARALEAEIERICEEGVAGITLDLRELAYIDSIGVAVIAFRCDLCRRHGYDFALIPGSRTIHRAFERAGVTDLLPFQKADAAAPRRLALVLGHRSRDDCEE